MTATTLDTPRAATSDDAAGSLTTREAIALVALALVHFFLLHGPIWLHPWSPNASIVYSYLPIPIFVALVLRRGRRLTTTSWFLGTLQVVTFKFVISAFALIAMWAITNPPPDAPATTITQTAPMPATTAKPGEPPPIALAIGSGTGTSTGTTTTIELAVGDRLAVHSGDGRMHTLFAPSLGLNVPIVAGTERIVRFGDPGDVELHCAVHPEEPAVHVVVK